MRIESAIPREELEELVAEYHHVHEEHRRARRGSRVRRHLHARLTEIGSRFDRLLAEAVPEASERTRWRKHLHHRAPEPRAPGARAPLLFRGRSQADSVLEVLGRADGSLDVVVDGSRVERLVAAEELLTTSPGLTFRVGGTPFGETFAASANALAALLASTAPSARPPYRYARELLTDGLIDRDFGLTPRGRRALELDRRERPALEQAPGSPREVTIRGRVSDRARHAAEELLARAARLAPRPVLFARAMLIREEDPALEQPAIAKASLDVSGRIVHAHVAAPEMSEAIDLLEERLRRRLAELSEREEAERQETGLPEKGQWRHGDLPASRPDYFPRPREERKLVRRKTFAAEPMSVEEAAWDMKLLDHDFHLFTNAATGEENVVYLGEARVLHLKQVSWSEGSFVDPVVIDASPAPVMAVPEALEALDVAGEPFLFFVERDCGRGAVAYRRLDGHYGLVSAGR